jgi:RND family efflux transporter MFP subunit
MNQSQHTLDALRIDRSAPRARRSLAWVWAVVLALVLIAAGAAGWFLRPRPPEVVVTVAREVAAGNSSRAVLNASGYVVARREATVSSKITGKVVEVLVEEGMRVEKDQVLARLDDTNLRAGFNLAEAQRASAKAALDETRARLAEADKEWRRVENLTSNRIATAADLDRAEAQVKALQARLAWQQTEVDVAEKQSAIWQQQLDDTVIRAPFAGIAVSKNAQPGEMISPVSAGGGFTRTGIGTIVDMSSLEIEVDVSESYINRVHPAQPVEATLDAYPDWKIPCKVIATIPTADRQKATVKVRVGFEKLDPRILPQMGVKVAFLGMGQVATGNRGVRVPKAAVRDEGGRQVVWVVRDGRVERRAVTISAGASDEVTVLAGLTTGESIVIEGPSSLQEGDRVRERSRQN